MPPISGFTIVRNAIKLDFPVEASIRSILPVCDEVVVNVGRSDDQTLDLVRSIDDPKIRIIESEWDLTIKNKVLGDETLRAMRACRHPWGIYIQADEVLHEHGAELLRTAIQESDDDGRVEGLLVRYHHFYGDLETVAVNRRWYRREVRAVRLDPALGIHPYQGAQGFRVGPENRRIRARLTRAEMFHYGWARPPEAIKARYRMNQTLYPWSAKREARLEAEQRQLPWFPGLTRFHGAHPSVAADWVAARQYYRGQRIAPPRFKPEHLRFRASDIIERLTGARVFEYRNYRLV